MSKEIYISSTPHETRLAIVENDDLTEIYYERENEYTLAGSIYNGKVTRVLPGMQSSFVDIGLERDAFLYITDFMEEAGDSAEFDSADGNGARRAPRDDRGTGREDRSAREDAPALLNETSSGQDRAVAGISEPRSDRGDRDAGRRRRSRGGNRDVRPSTDERTSGREQSMESTSSTVFPAVPALDTPAVHSGYTEPGTEGAGAEMGEGAPGADGSRRWRGRRGRRRGRNSAQREESQALQQPDIADGGVLPDRTSPTDTKDHQDGEEDLDREYADSFDLNASGASPASLSESAAPGASEPIPTSSFEDRGRRDRSDREPRDRNRRDGGGRDARTLRAPRGFAPSRALYGVESGSDDTGTDAPPAEPIILPGESLSKYRKADENAPQASTTSVTPLPTASTEFRLPGTWDGGAVLPGETIRPRSGSGRPAGASDRPRQDRGNRDRGARDGRYDRNDRTKRRDHSDRNDPNLQPAPAPPVRYSEQPGVENEDTRELASSSDFPRTALTSGSDVQTHPSKPVQEQREANTAAEYEPLEGSASVRFDARDVSEFRQSAATVEEPESLSLVDAALTRSEEEGHSLADATPEEMDRLAFDSPALPEFQDAPKQTLPETFSTAHTITPQPDTPVAQLHVDAADDAAPTHEFTTVQSTGEMVSDTLAPPPQGEISEPTSPLHHEAAVVESTIVPELSSETVAGSAQEKLISDEEEDFSATTLHASSIEEMDYDEDETLEGTADLGTMIREMSIDQITRPGEEPEDDEDILEEEYAADDAHPDSYEGSDEMEDDDEESRRPQESSEESGHEEFPRATSLAREEHNGRSTPNGDVQAHGAESSRDPERRSSRRDGGRREYRRDGRGRDRGGDRARSTGGSGDRSTSRPGRRDGRHSAQMTNLPAISDLLKPGQEVLVQIAKEPIAKKGARITSHIALPGRFLVFMPTVNHTGVSRKIESDGERRRLKEILLSEKGEASGGFIVRTAASGASEEELRSDLRFLLNLWADIKQRSEASKSPALIYHDLNLVERVLRDQVTDTFSAIWVDTETEYERVLRFLQRFQPSLIRRVKLYTKETPLFEQFGITEEINKALRSKVWLKSGGSIVINQTEALVAIDINTGKYVGKTARLEDTIVKTNLDAIPEIVRQIRLRDLGGIIIIDFIDMDERKNRHKVMAALEEELKKDRAPSKVLQFNDFGLVAITRKRVKQSLERTLSTTCNVCQGTGMTKSPVTICNDIYIEMRKMQKHLDRGDVMLRVNPEVVKQLKAGGTRWLQEMEEIVGKTILVKSDPSLHPEQFDIH